MFYGGLRIILRGVLRYAKREGYTSFSAGTFFSDLILPENIFSHALPKTDAEEVFTDEEVTLLLHHLRSFHGRAEHSSLLCMGIELMLVSGVRVGELSALRRCDIDTDALTLTINATETQYENEEGHRIVTVGEQPKTDAGYRTVYLPESARSLLKRILHFRAWGCAPTDFLFTKKDGTRIRSKSFNDALKRACLAVGIPARTTHKLRKTYASTLIDGSVNAKIIQKQLGHKDFSTTQKYYDRDRSAVDIKRREINRVINM